MQAIDQENNIGFLITNRQRGAIELLDRHAGFGSARNVKGTERKIGPQSKQLVGDLAVSRANVQHPGRRGNEVGQMACQDTGPPAHDHPLMYPLDQAHFFANCKMLTRKIDKTVWKPSAASVTPGTTSRMV